MADFILNMPLRFFARVFGNPAGDPVLLKSRGVTLLRDKASQTSDRYWERIPNFRTLVEYCKFFQISTKVCG